MQVSVIIPALNEAELIGGCVERTWRAGADEVLVVDGGSEDGTRDVAAAACQLIDSPAGRAVQQNAGARHACGEVLLFLHADNWLAAGAVDQVRRALADPAVCCGAFHQRIEAAGLKYRLLERGNALRVRCCGLAYGDQGIFVRRELFFELGGFAEVPLLEDLLLMRALRRRGWPRLLPGPLHVSARRWQQQGVVRQTLRNWYILAAHRCGVPPQRLAGWYARR